MRRTKVITRACVLAWSLLGCQGTVTGPDTSNGAKGGNASAGANNASNGGATSSSGAAGLGSGGASTQTPPFEATAASSAVRKVKGLLVGLAPTSDEVASVTAGGAAALQTLIGKWMGDSALQPLLRDKMVAFFRNAFQQTGFVPTEDFKHQLLENGGFDFGPLGTAAVGDDIFYRVVQNLEDSFALTAWQLVAENRPFSEVLSTRRFMLTTALKSLYLQIEMPNDQPYAGFGGTKPTTVQWKLERSGADIPLSQSLDPNSPNYLVFDDEAPLSGPGIKLNGFNTCQGNAVQHAYSGYALLFQRLLGFTQRYQFVASPECWEHASKPYFELSDTTDWGWVDISTKATADAYPQPYDLPTLRGLKELKLALPRVGFYTTPAYLAIWNTNDSNQHRVTVNQTLLVALGQSFTGDSIIVPVSTNGIDANHSVDGSECYGCHKSLDPMRGFWGSQLDFNDRNDFPQRGNFMGGAANPRPAKTGGIFAFGDVNVDKTGGTLHDLGPLLLQVHDTTQSQPITRFAMSITQKLCSFANSTPCLESDPEFRRVALAFEQSNFDFPTLVRELLSSPLVTGASNTATFADGMSVSIARRDQFCQALSNRLNRPDICAQLVPLPNATQKNTLGIAGNIPADAFGRGSENLVTPADPTLFFRAASEMLCEDVAVQVVDAPSNTVYSSSDATNGIADMVQRLMGYPPTDPHYADAVRILTEHYNAAKSASGGTATKAMQSTFAAACQSPTSLSFGL
ncbi:MAG: hypothetical protein QM756_21250 [Polyangiaceae bacterium]